MKKLIKSLLLIGLILLVSGCQNNITVPVKPKIDDKLPMIQNKFVRTMQDITLIALEWKPITIENARGYFIYRKDMQKDGKFKRIATIKNKFVTHYLDTKLEPNSKYVYKISMISKTGSESIATKDIEVTTLPNLKSVSLIDTVSDLPRQIKIMWRPHSNPRVSKYIIFRTSVKESKWQELHTVNNRLSVEYIDLDLGDNKTYSYRIKAVTFDNIISEPSATSSATTRALPNQISQLDATDYLPKKIQLSWAQSESKDVTLYNIYRATSISSRFKKIAIAKADHNRYDDDIATDGKIYFYKITTVDKDGLESKLKDMNPKMGKTLEKPNMPNITLSQIQGNKIILNWKSYDKRVVSFNIYKTTKESWIKEKEKLIPNVKGERFEDLDVVRGVKYTYSLQAVDKNGLLSEKTDKVTSMLPKLQIKAQKK